MARGKFRFWDRWFFHHPEVWRFSVEDMEVAAVLIYRSIQPPLQDTSRASSSPTACLPSSDATIKYITTPIWADITSRPPAPLTDDRRRRRQALHRFFNIIFPARHTIGLLIHEAYLSEFRSKLLEIDTSLILSFNPLDPDQIAGPKYHDLPQEGRTRLADYLHQDRCLRTLSFVRPNWLPGIARYFVRQGCWVPDYLAQDVFNNRIPRSSKRHPIAYPSSAAQVLQPTDTNTHPPSDCLPPQPSVLQSVSEDSEMDRTAPDIVSTPSNTNRRHPPSPTSSPRKFRKSSRLRRSKP
ncbi:hypothetical protein HMPREF1544_04374 [Mucor circinelloides 1006PhL]|uniref:Uncharacterized protein n=1 Tax=Mucor circinelloides f. circinelloides (strain 1006PhL) TaxID=1220926 RepID=S2K9D3_MUCC1|nr:hypothetical protein HMPREF1544_04374 [Mucor circinelloides 1006PhL]